MIFSHSIHQDPASVPVKKCIVARLKVDASKGDPPLYYDQYSHGALAKIIQIASLEDVECQEVSAFALAHLASDRDLQGP